MTEFEARVADMSVRVQPAEWTLPLRSEPFLDWLDDAGLAEDTYDAVAAFMALPIAKQMPQTLKDDLRSEGYPV